jgi:hypothetical protein
MNEHHKMKSTGKQKMMFSTAVNDGEKEEMGTQPQIQHIIGKSVLMTHSKNSLRDAIGSTYKLDYSNHVYLLNRFSVAEYLIVLYIVLYVPYLKEKKLEPF